MEEITQTDMDNLADILWWIKGFRYAHSKESIADDVCPFREYHEESIRKIRSNWAEEQRKRKIKTDMP